MANVPETSVFTPGVYLIETTDPVEGGSDGISNRQAIALANRTLYLKNLFESVMAPILTGNCIMIWNRPAAEIPPGWEAVEGDFEGRFPVGRSTTDAQFGSTTNSGGSKTASLIAANNGPHSHTYNGSEADQGDLGQLVVTAAIQPTGSTVTSSSSGTGQPFSIMNPYKVVEFIRWVGL